jgi:iron complex outermembrane receptor protein
MRMRLSLPSEVAATGFIECLRMIDDRTACSLITTFLTGEIVMNFSVKSQLQCSSRSRLRPLYHLGAVGLLVIAATEVVAQEQAAPEQAAPASPASEEIQDVVVTGTRIVRDGYSSPTPMTVVGADALQQSAQANIADVLHTIPVFAGSATPQTSPTSVSAQGTGVNLLNLRDMGAQRTLVLVDGQRSVGANFSGVVDINTIPQQLVQRVDIVTGGASAIYGSDAVTGVVNFILDKTFTGVKGEASGGMTTYGDDKEYKVSLTAGTGFADNRGHFIISGELNRKVGILGNNRAWDESQLGIVQNSAANVAAGQPQRLVMTGVDPWFTRGGTIKSGPLKGIDFGPGGVPGQFQFGSVTDSIYTAGGDSALGEIRNDTGSLDPQEKLGSIFTRLSYDITDNINAFAQFSWNYAYDFNWAFSTFQLGNGATIHSGNPFIPASVQSQMTALGLSSFQLGSMNYDLPFIGPQLERQTFRYVAGASGSFDLLNKSWKWNTYWQTGVTLVDYNAIGPTRNSLRAQAADAVIDPATGNIVCRSTLTNPNNGCVPYDPMGLGVNSPAVINFLTDGGQHPHTDERIQEDVVAGDLSGEPFSDWAGPVSIALSIEHRRESGSSNPSQATLAGDWFSGNFYPFSGQLSVTEGAFETVVPLAKKTWFANSWDLSAAVRETDYSVSGAVTTWKVGTTYEPIPGIRLRATRSRDIRAPSLQDLYNSSSGGFDLAFDPVCNCTASIFTTNKGNPNLAPETADTTEFGIVLQPTFLRGFTASVDYWNINLTNAIVSPTLNEILIFCADGIQSYCADITRVNGTVTAAAVEPINIAVQNTRGIDIEISYLLPDGLGFHLEGTKYLRNYQNTNLAPATDNVGEMESDAPPNWMLIGRTDYSGNNWNTGLTFRAMSSGVLSNQWIQCTSNCPIVSAPFSTINDNHAPGFFYVDWSIAKIWNLNGSQLETFLNINNIFNRDPGLIPKGSDQIGYEVGLSNPSKYDVLGRVFRAGIRFKL